MRDPLVKLLLVTIACLLLANIYVSLDPQSSPQLPAIIGNAEAQSTNNNNSAQTNTTYRVRRIEGYTVEDLKEVVPVGDGRSFVVSNSKGFMVYQVAPNR